MGCRALGADRCRLVQEDRWGFRSSSGSTQTGRGCKEFHRTIVEEVRGAGTGYANPVTPVGTHQNAVAYGQVWRCSPP